MHPKQNNKEGRTYLQGLRPFKKLIPKNLKKILNKRGYTYSEIVGKWNIIVGDKIANACFPKSVLSKKNDQSSILNLSVKRGEEIEIEYSKNFIMNKINSYFGYQLISEIKLETFSDVNIKKKNTVDESLKKSLSKFDREIANINNQKIKDALCKLINIIKK